MSRVIFLGGTGFVGSHLCNVLNGKGFEVTAASLDPDKSVFPLDEDISRKKLDILNLDGSGFDEFYIVINLVGLSPLRKPKGASYDEVHVKGVENVVKSLNESNSEILVHMSALGADSSSSIDYIRTKGIAEDLVREKVDNHIILRPTVIFGEGGEFIKSLEKPANISPVFPLPLMGETRFQPIYIGDFTHAVADIIEQRSEFIGEALNFGGPEVLTFKQIVEKNLCP